MKTTFKDVMVLALIIAIPLSMLVGGLFLGMRIERKHFEARMKMIHDLKCEKVTAL